MKYDTPCDACPAAANREKGKTEILPKEAGGLASGEWVARCDPRTNRGFMKIVLFENFVESFP